VAEYKLYCLDPNGRIQRRHEYESADDGAAIARARAEFPDETCELWSGTRKVALIPAGGEPILSKPI
jgi:hypothetical protein